MERIPSAAVKNNKDIVVQLATPSAFDKRNPTPLRSAKRNRKSKCQNPPVGPILKVPASRHHSMFITVSLLTVAMQVHTGTCGDVNCASRRTSIGIPFRQQPPRSPAVGEECKHLIMEERSKPAGTTDVYDARKAVDFVIGAFTREVLRLMSITLHQTQSSLRYIWHYSGSRRLPVTLKSASTTDETEPGCHPPR